MITRSLPSTRAERHLFREEGGKRREQKVANVALSAHQSVLTREVVELLAPKRGDIVLDATAGEGGHSVALLNAAPITLIALDADPRAVEHTRVVLKPFGANAVVVEANFANLREELVALGRASITKALFDLGWNRGQRYSGLGFSFQTNEPLVMSYGRKPASGFTAADILNHWSESAIADALWGYGEERYARRIAKAVCARRAMRPLTTTGELVELIRSAVPLPYTRGRRHFATRTFQALRIAVNDELGVLKKGLASAWEMLEPGGRMAFISFHSIEDRLVKRLLREFAAEGGTLITKKPVVASRAEVLENPSARSAKLRVIEKTLLFH